MGSHHLAPLPGRQNQEKVDSEAFHQLITHQQLTEGRPPQQWRILNCVCYVLENKIANGENLNPKKNMENRSSWSISVIL